MDDPTVSDFPRYLDGDVAIYLTASKLLQLHSPVLRRNSRVLRELLDSAPPAKLSKKAKEEKLPCYRLDLVKPSGNYLGDDGVFQRKDLDTHGRCRDDDIMGMDFTAGKIPTPNDSTRYWEWLFAAFYNRQPELDSQTLAVVLNACMGFIDVAESVEAVDTVREIVDLALLRQGKTLWESIARNPTVWAELGRRVHSPMILTESVCHVVGRWQSLEPSAKDVLHPDLRSLCERKHHEMDVAKRAVELRILGHYPAALCRNAADKPGRPSYANDIYMWMAISFFRQWFAQMVDDEQGRRGKDGGYRFYEVLSEGGSAYLNHTTFKEFHKYFPMSSKACNILELNMGAYKEEIKPFVKDLVKSQVHLDLKVHPVEWLTCCVVNKEDYPWYKPQTEEGQEESGGDEMDFLFGGRLGSTGQNDRAGDGDGDAGADADADGEGDGEGERVQTWDDINE